MFATWQKNIMLSSSHWKMARVAKQEGSEAMRLGLRICKLTSKCVVCVELTTSEAYRVSKSPRAQQRSKEDKQPSAKFSKLFNSSSLFWSFVSALHSTRNSFGSRMQLQVLHLS